MAGEAAPCHLSDAAVACHIAEQRALLAIHESAHLIRANFEDDDPCERDVMSRLSGVHSASASFVATTGVGEKEAQNSSSSDVLGFPGVVSAANESAADGTATMGGSLAARESRDILRETIRALDTLAELCFHQGETQRGILCVYRTVNLGRALGESAELARAYALLAVATSSLPLAQRATGSATAWCGDGCAAMGAAVLCATRVGGLLVAHGKWAAAESLLHNAAVRLATGPVSAQGSAAAPVKAVVDLQLEWCHFLKGDLATSAAYAFKVISGPDECTRMRGHVVRLRQLNAAGGLEAAVALRPQVEELLWEAWPTLLVQDKVQGLGVCLGTLVMDGNWSAAVGLLGARGRSVAHFFVQPLPPRVDFEAHASVLEAIMALVERGFGAVLDSTLLAAASMNDSSEDTGDRPKSAAGSAGGSQHGAHRDSLLVPPDLQSTSAFVGAALDRFDRFAAVAPVAVPRAQYLRGRWLHVNLAAQQVGDGGAGATTTQQQPQQSVSAQDDVPVLRQIRRHFAAARRVGVRLHMPHIVALATAGLDAHATGRAIPKPASADDDDNDDNDSAAGGGNEDDAGTVGQDFMQELVRVPPLPHDDSQTMAAMDRDENWDVELFRECLGLVLEELEGLWGATAAEELLEALDAIWRVFDDTDGDADQLWVELRAANSAHARRILQLGVARYQRAVCA